MATVHISEALPMEALLGAIPTLPRPLLSRLTACLIERLDEVDGDPDFQDTDGDELDHSGAEDDFCDQPNWKGEPGCPISDPGGGNVEDEGEAIDECEREQMIDDVPSLQVFAIEPDVVTGKRQCLGMSNLSPAFVATTMPTSV